MRQRRSCGAPEREREAFEPDGWQNGVPSGRSQDCRVYSVFTNITGSFRPRLMPRGPAMSEPIPRPTCPACDHPDVADLHSWDEWTAACAERSDGAMRLAASAAAGVTEAAPSLVKCSGCGSVFMQPVPSAAQLDSFYQEYHGTEDYVLKAGKKVLRAVKRLLPFRALTGGPFLEVGASIGTAAEAARRLGFQGVVAQEIDGDAVARGRVLFPQIEFFNGRIENLVPERPFGMIYCAEVIEHVPDPLVFARRLRALMAPGAWVFLTTPDAGHARVPARFVDWKSVKPPEHVVLFTKIGLSALFEGAGFTKPFFPPQAKPGVRMICRKPAAAVAGSGVKA